MFWQPRPFFESVEAAQDFVLANPLYKDKILQFWVGDKTFYVVLTGVVGFVNHFGGLSKQGNAKLVARPEMGLGQRLFVLHPGLSWGGHQGFFSEA